MHWGNLPPTMCHKSHPAIKPPIHIKSGDIKVWPAPITQLISTWVISGWVISIWVRKTLTTYHDHFVDILYRFSSFELHAFRMPYIVYPGNSNGVVSQTGTSLFNFSVMVSTSQRPAPEVMIINISFHLLSMSPYLQCQTCHITCFLSEI